MSKKVRFDDNVQEKRMSIDWEAHRREVKDPVAFGGKSIPSPESGGVFLYWGWIVLFVLVVLIIAYLIWRYYFKKPKTEPPEQTETKV